LQIGSLLIDIYGELLFDNAVEHFTTSMSNIFRTVSDKFDYDDKRFAFYAARIKFVVPLKIMWRNDVIYNGLIRNLNYSFDNWTLDITLLIKEERS
jgi:hypothetical protein